jgi:hypothetical protein
MRIMKQIFFLNSIERMKKNISKCMKIKYKFLLEIRNTGMLRRCYRMGHEFHYAKKSVYNQYDFLSDLSEKKYAPL